ncbi:MAG: RadC family protein [Bacteroidia bacterium]
MNQPEYLSIKTWAEDDRPREKLSTKGRAALSDAELIAILIGSGSKNESAVDLSKRILQSVGNNLSALGSLSINDLMKFKGIGEAKAITIAAALELGRRRSAEQPNAVQPLTTSQSVYNYIAPQLQDLPHEEFWLITLNRANKPLGKHFLSKGGITATLVDIRLLIKQAIDALAVGVILVHNHPSGNLKPSEQDKQLTKRVKDALSLIEISLLDHLIIGNNTYFSFADEHLL